MSKTGAVLCCLSLLFCSLTGLSVSAAGITYSITELAGKYKTQGRVREEDGKLYPDWSASGIEFTADCEGDVYVNFTSAGTCYFTVLVDGVALPRNTCLLSNTSGAVKIASGLSRGTHRFALYRQTEIGVEVAITGITLSGTVGPAPAANTTYIEFIGDSITTGYGNLANRTTGGESGSARYTDATQGYAYLTANALNADFSLVAVQGIGASVGYQPYTMLKTYPRQCSPLDSGCGNYAFSRQADVVVIALGTNDLSQYANKGHTLSDVKQGFAELLALARSKHPQAHIVWICGMMTGNADTLIREVMDEAGGTAKRYYTLKLPQSNSGGNGHPSAAEHRVFAEELTAFINAPFAVPTTTATTTTTAANAPSHTATAATGTVTGVTKVPKPTGTTKPADTATTWPEWLIQQAATTTTTAPAADIPPKTESPSRVWIPITAVSSAAVIGGIASLLIYLKKKKK